MCKEHFDRRMVQEDMQLSSMIHLFKQILPKFDFGKCKATPPFTLRRMSELDFLDIVFVSAVYTEVRKDDSRRVSDLHNPTPVKPRYVIPCK